MPALHAILANLILLIDCLMVGMLLFTLLPLSVAILTLPINVVTFFKWRARLKMGSYLAAIHGIAFLLSVIFFILIVTFGPEHFKLVLDWV